MFDKLFFGTENYAYIHYLLDHGNIPGIDYVRLFGHAHRKIMHDQRAVEFITLNYGYDAGRIAAAHIALDKVWSHSKRNGSKK